MRRSRFAGAVKVNERDDRARWLDTLSFDVRSPVSSDDSAIAQQRLTQLTYVPILLAVATSFHRPRSFCNLASVQSPVSLRCCSR